MSGLQSAPLSVWCDFSRKLSSRPQRGCKVTVCSHFRRFNWDSDTRACAVQEEGAACMPPRLTGTGRSKGCKAGEARESTWVLPRDQGWGGSSQACSDIASDLYR